MKQLIVFMFSIIFISTDAMIANNNNLYSQKRLISAVHVNDLNEIDIAMATGASIEQANGEGSTILHSACEKGNMDVIKKLVEDYHANVNAVNFYNITPIRIALWFKHFDVVEYLIEQKANINIVGIDNASLLFIASAYGNVHMVELLLNNGAMTEDYGIKGLTPLHIAAQNNYKEVVKFFIDQQWDVNKRSLDGKTPLHVAAQQGHYEMVKFLILQHADVNAFDQQGYTAIHLAILERHLNVTKLLLQHGAIISLSVFGLIYDQLALAPYTDIYFFSKIALDLFESNENNLE